MRTVVCAALAVAALACATWLHEGKYAVGLDFEGGARVVVRPSDAQKTLLHALAVRPRAEVQIAGDSVMIYLQGGDADDVAVLERELASDGEVSSTGVSPACSPSLGRPLATIVAFAAAACWLGVLARALWPLAMVGTMLLVWTATVVDQLAIGGTLSIPVEVAGVLLGVAASPAAWPRRGEPLERLRRAWPVGAAFLALLVLSAVLVPHLSAREHPIALHALRFVRHSSVAALAIAACAVLAAGKGEKS